jgi:hypothetical protein
MAISLVRLVVTGGALHYVAASGTVFRIKYGTMFRFARGYLWRTSQAAQLT